MPLIQGNVSWVRGFEIGGQALVIAPPQRMLHHGRAISASLPGRVDAYERQIPVRLVRMISSHLLEYCKRVCPLPIRNTLVQKRRQHLFVGSGIGRQPERNARVSLADECGTARELAAGGPGTSANLARLAELLFTEAVRAYVKALPPGQRGWLAGLRDPVVGRTLALIHGQLVHPWTLDELVREVGLSRSTLTERFTRHIGVPPMRYLSRCRLLLAAERLREGQQSVAEIGYEVGYESEAAFSRAFKREFGMAPGAFRKETFES